MDFPNLFSVDFFNINTLKFLNIDALQTVGSQMAVSNGMLDYISAPELISAGGDLEIQKLHKLEFLGFPQTRNSQ